MRKTLVGFVVCCLLAIAPPAAASPNAPAPTPTPPAQRADPLAQQIEHELQQQTLIDATKAMLQGEIGASKGQRGTLGALILQEQQSIDDTTAKTALAEQRLQDANEGAAADAARGDAARLRADHDKTLLASSIRTRYVDQDGLLDYVLASRNFSDMMSRAAAVTTITSLSAQLLPQINADIAEANSAQSAAAAEAAQAAAEAAALVTQSQQLQTQVATDNSLIEQLSAQERAAAVEIQQANGQDLALVEQIAAQRIEELDATIAKAEAADWDAATFFLQNHLGTVPTPIPPDPGLPGTVVRFIWPAPGAEITQPFGPSPYAFEPPAFGFPHFHTGIDLAAPLGTPIYAAGDGVVVAASSSDVGYGNHIIIACDTETLTLYGHLESMGVQPGQTVHQGQLIGLMGSTGNSTGPHLHFEVRVNNVPVNPVPFLPQLPPGATGPPALAQP